MKQFEKMTRKSSKKQDRQALKVRLQKDPEMNPTSIQVLYPNRHAEELTSLQLSGCGFSQWADPSAFEYFLNVITIKADGNNLPIEAFAGFRNLRCLGLRDNALMFINPSIQVQQFAHLKVLDLAGNGLGPECLEVLGRLAFLQELHLARNKIMRIPLHLLGFRRLRLLGLESNSISNVTAFLGLATLPSLNALRLDSNYFMCLPCILNKPQIVPEKIVTSMANRYPNYLRSQQPEKPKKKVKKVKKKRKKNKNQGKFVRKVLQMRKKKLGKKVKKKKKKHTTTYLTVDQMSRELAKAASEKTRKLSYRRWDIAFMDQAGTMLNCGDPGDKSGIPTYFVAHQPFPKLRTLSVQKNLLTNEKDLMAIVTWPSLRCIDVRKCPIANRATDSIRDFLRKCGVNLKVSANPAPKIITEGVIRDNINEFSRRDSVISLEEVAEVTFECEMKSLVSDTRFGKPLPLQKKPRKIGINKKKKMSTVTVQVEPNPEKEKEKKKKKKIKKDIVPIPKTDTPAAWTIMGRQIINPSLIKSKSSSLLGSSESKVSDSKLLRHHVLKTKKREISKPLVAAASSHGQGVRSEWRIS